MGSLHQGFQEAGQEAGQDDPQAVFRWLDGADGHPLIQGLKRAMLEISPVGAGDQVLDVGCGLGHEVRRLGQLVGPRGRVAGIDANAGMIAEASRRAEASRQAGACRQAGASRQAGEFPVAFEVGDAHRLEFPDRTFDLCRTERVLRYVDQPAVVLAEMIRVTRPAGSVLVFDFDSDSTIVDLADSVLARRVATVLDAAVPHPWIGRQLFGLFHQAGLADVRVIPHVICFTGAPGFALYQQLNRGTVDRAIEAGLTASEVAAWWLALEQAAQAGTFFVANLGFVAVGRKP